LSLTIADGEFLTLLGPSGCGKSTTLAALAGLDVPDGGTIRVGKDVYFDAAQGINLPPERRSCGLVFQSYALWPHMTVFGNCEFPLKLRKVPAAERRSRIAEALKLVEMDAFAERFPHQLSGGQQQRVALARTLVYRPLVLLLDEPLSNLDARLRERSRVWLSQVTKQVGLTTVYVTHDQSEALALSDRIAVMNKGRISQLGTPRDIYNRPSDAFVADFIGSSNFLKGRTDGKGGIDLSGGARIELPTPRSLAAGAAVVVAVKPEDLRLHSQRPAGKAGGLVAGKLIGRSYLGARTQYLVHTAGTELRVESTDTAHGTQDGQEVWVEISEGCGVAFETEGNSAS
jgi:iron(III) transport system ATP-binding protein